MGNINSEEAERLVLNGWSPRVKRVKNKQYITIRKGNEERSLGSYDENLWRKLTDLASPNQ